MPFRLNMLVFTFVFGLLLFSFTGTATAETTLKQRWSAAHEEIHGARTLAMGRAYLAIAEGNAAGWTNPAGMAQRPIYSFDISGEFDPLGDAYSAGLSVVDAVTTPVAMYMGYTFNGYDSQQLWNISNFHNYNPDYNYYDNLSTPSQLTQPVGWVEDWVQNSDYGTSNDNSWDEYRRRYLNGTYQDYLNSYIDPEDYPQNPLRSMLGSYKDGDIYRHVARLGLAGAITEEFMLGASVKYAWAKRPMRHDVNAANVDLGILLRTEFGLNVGLVAQNLIHTAYDMWPLKLGGGLAYVIYDELYVDIDTIVVLDSYQERPPSNGYYTYESGAKVDVRFGVEYIVNHMVPLRFGYEYDQTVDNQYISAGVAYKEDMFSVNFAYNQGLKIREDRLIGVSLSFDVE